MSASANAVHVLPASAKVVHVLSASESVLAELLITYGAVSAMRIHVLLGSLLGVSRMRLSTEEDVQELINAIRYKKG